MLILGNALGMVGRAVTNRVLPLAQREAALKKKADDKILKTSAFTGSKEKRQAFRALKGGIIRQRRLDAMTPDQRETALKNEADNTARVEALAKKKDDAKLMSTVAIGGSKEKRAAFKSQKAALIRQKRLDAMTPEQQKTALQNEADNKAATEAKAKKAQETKLMSTVAIGGSKAERDAFKSQKAALIRQKRLDAMTPEQQKTALQNEADNKARAEAKKQKEADDKTRRTVAKVGSKEEREKFRADKARVKRADKLATMTDEEKEDFFESEKKAQESAAEVVKKTAEAKAKATVAVVGDAATRRAFRESKMTDQVKDGPQEVARQTSVRSQVNRLRPQLRGIRQEGARIQMAAKFRHLEGAIALLS